MPKPKTQRDQDDRDTLEKLVEEVQNDFIECATGIISGGGIDLSDHQADIKELITDGINNSSVMQQELSNLIDSALENISRSDESGDSTLDDSSSGGELTMPGNGSDDDGDLTDQDNGLGSNDGIDSLEGNDLDGGQDDGNEPVEGFD